MKSPPQGHVQRPNVRTVICGKEECPVRGQHVQASTGRPFSLIGSDHMVTAVTVAVLEATSQEIRSDH